MRSKTKIIKQYHFFHLVSNAYMLIALHTILSLSLSSSFFLCCLLSLSCHLSLSLSPPSFSYLLSSDIAAYPDSVNVLQPPNNSIRDVRTPDKLIDRVIDSHEPHHMWLSPILPGIYNTIYIIFDRPQTLSSITMWNYGKTPSRGVKEFSVRAGPFIKQDLTFYAADIGR